VILVFEVKILDLRELLKEYDLVILRDNYIIYKSKEPGIAPLVKAIEQLGNEILRDTVVADRIVGKAAALLIAFFKAKHVFAFTMSKPAISVLRKYNISFEYLELVDVILNREKTDMCPFEKMTLEIDDPKEAYELIKNRLCL